MPIYPLLDSKYIRPNIPIRPYPQASQNVISLFDGGAGVEWSKSSVNGTVADETTNYIKGSQAISITIDSATIVSAVSTVALNLSANTHAYLSFNIVDTTKWADFWLQFSTDAGYTQTYSYNVYSTMQNGWNTYVIPTADFTATGGADWSSIIRARVYGTGTAGNTATAYLDEVGAVTTQLSIGAIVLAFDDCWATHLTQAAPYMDKYGYKGVIFPHTSGIDVSGSLTIAQIKQLQDEHGWEVGSHGTSHSDLTGLTAGQIENDLLLAQDLWEKNGIAKPVSFASPGGFYNSTVLTYVKKYFECHRGVKILPATQPWPLLNRWELHAYPANASKALATVEGIVDTCETNADVLIIYFHKLVAAGATGSEWTISDFQDLMDYIKTKNVDVVTLKQLITRSE